MTRKAMLLAIVGALVLCAPASEAAIRTAVRDVAGQRAVVRSSVKSFERSSAPCRRLRVPRNRRAQVSLFSAAAESRAIFGPIDSQLQAFVSALGAVRTTD